MLTRFLRAASPVVLAALAASLPSACSSTAAPESFDAGAPLVIGVLQSLTGSDSSVGPPLKNAARVAEWQINAAGGVLGKRVEFRFEDDGSKVDLATAAADRFLGAGVVAAIGPTTSTPGAALAPKFFDAKTILLSSTVVATSLTTAQPAKDRYFFRTVPAADIQGRVLADVAAKGPSGKTACKRMAAIISDDATGNSYADAIRQELGLRGGSLVKEIKVKTEVASDYKAEIAQLITAGASPTYDCLGLFVFPPVGAQFMRDYKNAFPKSTDPKFADWDKTYVVTWHVLFTSAFVTQARANPTDASSPSAAEGVIGIVVDPTPDTPEYNEFRRQYVAQFPAEGAGALARNTANTYDGAMLILLAIEKAGTATDRVKVRDALFEVSRQGTVFTPSSIPEAIAAIRRGEDIDYKGASGPVDFDDYGNVKEDFTVWRVEGNALKTTGEKIRAEEIQ